jgi:hypothetical protein
VLLIQIDHNVSFVGDTDPMDATPQDRGGGRGGGVRGRGKIAVVGRADKDSADIQYVGTSLRVWRMIVTSLDPLTTTSSSRFTD